MPQITGVLFLGLSVRDVRRSAAWYRALLDLVTLHESPAGAWHHGATLLREPSSGLLLGLSAHRGNAGEPFDESRTGLDHVEFGVISRAELDRWVARLDSLGITHSGIQERSLGALVTFRDPDNIQLEFYWAQDHGTTSV